MIYRRARELGDEVAANCRGNMLVSGRDIPQDYPQALALYEKAAAEGHPGAQCQAGFCYERGLGCERDPDKAFSYYTKSAENDDETAANALGYLYEHGIGCTADAARAAELFEKAGRLGQPLGWKNLGLLYEKGLGVPKDAELAKKYMTMAAQQNVSGAAEALERLNTEKKRLPATGLRIASCALLAIAAFLGIGLWDGAPSERLFSGVFTLFFVVSAGFILYKVNRLQPQLPKALRTLYVIGGILLLLLGILILLSPSGENGPLAAEDYWLIGCCLLGGDVLVYHGLRRKK